ncbi:hypothetical protein GX51_03056 [Blastomyces parvus]|uniref:Heterokaryon incompatibility domain-containing protein n=1 Tax=Blastomyces parvus TaxID=2060905 RepID=A0A2B7X8P9_9EURO|nr:hypothetical protein GX51_03056 [Blastomyces parvus]
MASNSSEDAMWNQAEQLQRTLPELLASGRLEPEKEIQLRTTLARVFLQRFELQGSPDDLYTAINHLECVVPHIPKSVESRVTYLDQLSYMKMSSFGITYSMKDLDESISYARQAKAEAAPTCPILYKIYHNLGYSLSHRAQFSGSNHADIDDAIACGREVLRLAPPQSVEYETSVTNLAMRLQVRYIRDHRTEDIEEAFTILNRQLERYAPGTPQHGHCLVAKAEFAYQLFKRTDDLKDLNEALLHLQDSLATLFKGHEKRVELIRRISELYECKHRLSGDPSHLRLAAESFSSIIQQMPPSHPTRADFVAHHLILLKNCVLASNSMSEVQETIKEAIQLRDQVPVGHAKRHSSGLSVGNMLARRYIISHELQDLMGVVKHAIETCHEFVALQRQNGIGRIIDISPLRELSSWISKVNDASFDVPTAKSAQQKVYQYFCSIYNPEELMSSLIKLQLEKKEHLNKLLEDMQSTNQVTTDTNQTQEIVNKRFTETGVGGSDHAAGRRQYLKPDGYRDEFTGLRHLAIDPTSNRIVVQMESIVNDLYGYANQDPLSWSEFSDREDRLEREAFDRERHEGKSPNPQLCRICRDVKPLVSKESGGHTWNSKLFLPMGNWRQLRCRKHCTICRLILSLIEMEPGRLHPRLAEMDREIQGTQFNIQKLPTGETMLGVEYGMRPVGAIRIITPRNHADAVRQDWQKFPYSSQGQLVDPSKLWRWLEDCYNNHGRVCNSSWSNRGINKEIPLLLIDVSRSCLVHATSAEKYFSLSYVWGKVKMPTTMKANLQDRLKEKSLNEDNCELPQTIKDAMSIVRSLGERYLWIDLLCIVQDDLDTKYHDIRNMDIVYGKSFATIVAMHGNDATAGLPGILPDTRPPQAIESIVLSEKPSSPQHHAASTSSTNEVTLTTTPSPLPLILETARWDTRGWTLQEELLSRRRIYFSSNYVYFQCNQETMCETTLEGAAEIFGKPLEVPRPIRSENPLAGLKKTGLLPRNEGVLRIFQVYKKLVEQYTSRELSIQSDILNAFSGILAVLADHLKSSFVSGFPAAALDLALLWTPVYPLTRRISSRTAPIETDKGVSFPSWSWAGWLGAVEYRLLEAATPSCQVLSYYTHHHGALRRIHGRDKLTDSTGVKYPPDHLPDISSSEFEHEQVNVAGPDLGPNVLQFWSEVVDTTRFQLSTTNAVHYLSKRDHVHTRGEQAVLRLVDRKGRHCGLVFDTRNDFVRRTFARHSKGTKVNTSGSSELVAISKSADVNAHEVRHGLQRVEGEIDVFDKHEFPATGRGSSVVNALIVQWDHELSERITVAQVHIRAWEEARPKHRHIRLA